MDRHGKKAKAAPTSPTSERSDLKSGQRTQWDKPAAAARTASSGRDGAAREASAKAPRGGRAPK